MILRFLDKELSASSGVAVKLGENGNRCKGEIISWEEAMTKA
jgi:hypothetical protein